MVCPHNNKDNYMINYDNDNDDEEEDKSVLLGSASILRILIDFLIFPGL